MRRHIEPDSYKGEYTDRASEGDLLIMGAEPETVKGRFPLDAGIYDSLWRLSLETELGLVVDIRRIPLDQEFIDGCNREDTDPYEAAVEGEIYIARPESSYHLRDDLTVIGYLTAEKVCKIKNRNRISFLKS